jgi:mono/diheme cytochrome c family protein
MKVNQIKLVTVAGFVFSLIAVVGFKTNGILTAKGSDADIAAVYKTKCAVCHTAKAEKFFDLSKTDEQHAEVILNGKKGAKPPFMPEFATKGVTPEQAKALAVYMRKLRTPESANTNAPVNTANSNAVGKANTNANTTVNANANANVNVNTNANSNVNANTVVNVNANVSANSNATVKKIPDAELAAIYKKNCAACHSPKAEKSYDPAMPFEEQVAAILKGKKAAKPPNMPGFETKGITAEQAGALAEYMKSLRTPNK